MDFPFFSALGLASPLAFSSAPGSFPVLAFLSTGAFFAGSAFPARAAFSGFWALPALPSSAAGASAGARSVSSMTDSSALSPGLRLRRTMRV